MFSLDDEKIQQIIERVAGLELPDRAHGLDHWKRVAGWTWRLYKEEQLENWDNYRLAMACGLLHDCYPVAKNSPDRPRSAELSAARAGEWLKEMHWAANDIEEVVMAIEDHSFSGGRLPRTYLGKCLQDADRLEALGAFGLYRTIATGVSMGADLFSESDPWASVRPLDDKKFTIDHFFTKLLKLPETFQTATGRRYADQRAKFLEDFLDLLKRDLE